MNYAYDLYGWYTGEVPEGAERSTPIAPPKARAPMRANWQGNYWFVAEYREPSVQQEPAPEKLSIEDRVAKLEARIAAR